MTVATESRERQRRIAAAWAQNPDSDVDVIAEAGRRGHGGRSRKERREADEHTAGVVASMNRMMFQCNACGGTEVAPSQRWTM